MGTSIERAHNFNPGPAALPLSALEQAARDFVNYQGAGLSIMEMSHRGHIYDQLHHETLTLLRELLQVPSQYAILLLQGGASLQYGMLPMNLLPDGKKAAFLLSDSFSEKAWKEATTVGGTRIAASTKAEQYRRVPRLDEMVWDDADAYVHITSNNTIFGTQWHAFPDTGQVPLVADMTSDILSRPIDVAQFGVIYASAQKNIGPAGATVVIIREDLIEQGARHIPAFLQYRTHAVSGSLYNTPPTYTIYMMGLVLKWIQSQGGVGEMQRQNAAKADLLYKTLDGSGGFYQGHAAPDSRSHMNVTFRLATTQLEELFIQEAQRAGFVGIRRHPQVNACRVSIYNAVPMASCQALQAFMIDFQKRYG